MRWEYLHLDLQEIRDDWKRYHEERIDEASFFEQKLDELGQDRWELIKIVEHFSHPMMGYMHYCYVFKRKSIRHVED